MLYLLFLRDGFIKKFPLDKKVVMLGRSKACDFSLDVPLISKEHVRITVCDDYIDIQDLNSTNGTYVDSTPIQEARIGVDQWFRIGYLKFFLKEGDRREFVISDKVQPVSNKIANIAMSKPDETAEALNLLEELSFMDPMDQQDGITPPEYVKERPPKIVTINEDMMNLLSRCRKIGKSDLFVLIKGETGTGKELVASFIHSQSMRKDGKFVALNCAAIPESLMENELFGHEKGAFTDARTRRIGKLELASSGTLVMDEVGDMPLNLQAKLLRAIQEGQFYRVGGNEPIHVDLRVICLTNKNITDMIEQGDFRQDLYYRIAHVVLHVPPLRKRTEDIVPLINYFLETYSLQNHIFVKGFSREAIRAMEIYPWPGNVRELQNEVKKLVNLSEDGDVIDLHLLKEEIVNFYKANETVKEMSDQFERKRLLELLEEYKWNKSQVARALNISRPSLYEKLKKHGI
jgi:transcriptional regulator with PAS, ATPase and Fis domain